MCGTRRYRSDHGTTRWVGYDAPRRHADEDLRASDEDREKVARLLRDSAGDGRLDVDELSERLDRVYAARTFGELREVTRDLPVAAPRSRDLAPRRRHVPATFVWVSVLLVAIWAATGAGYFWPVWPMLWFAFATMRSRVRVRRAA